MSTGPNYRRGHGRIQDTGRARRRRKQLVPRVEVGRWTSTYAQPPGTEVLSPGDSAAAAREESALHAYLRKVELGRRILGNKATNGDAEVAALGALAAQKIRDTLVTQVTITIAAP